MDFREFLQNNIVLLDGATGSLLLEKGVEFGKFPEKIGVTLPQVLVDIHKEYYDAGSNVVCTNTFGANILKYDVCELEEIIKCAIANVKKARDLSTSDKPKFVSLDLGPTGKMLKPFGDLDFSDAIEVFKTTVKIALKYGVDLFSIETMNDGYETKAAVLAVKECCDLPILVSNVYGSDKHLVSGADAESMVATLEGLGVDAIGANCSLGPTGLFPVIEEMLKYSSTPVIFKPNAGLPKIIDGKSVYSVEPKEFAKDVYSMVKKGVRVIGGCCGTTPKHILELNKLINGTKIIEITDKNKTVVSSFSHAVYFDKPVLVGERINPTGKKRLKQAIIEKDYGYILEEAVNEQKSGAQVLDVNVGIPEVDEKECLVKSVLEIQSVVDTPLQIDTVSKSALENALRVYNGKPLINSVNGKKESMDVVFPLAKKYGGVIVCLTLDENGIPNTANERVEIAKKIEKEALKYGITKKDLIFDTLTLTVSSDKNAGKITLDALKQLSKLGYKTILGVSNVSYGLPKREIINSTFFALALSYGLSSAIINPFSQEMMKTYYSFLALTGLDDNFANYISFSTGIESGAVTVSGDVSLCDCIKNGLKEQAKNITKQLIKTKTGIEIINEYIIPALNGVGQDYEAKKVFLPQLLTSAESAKASFDAIKENTVKGDNSRLKIVLATVKGDIHDIGKNIVKMMLENYGFNVCDLGKDVPKEIIVNKVIEEKAKLCGLSALMTTTVKNMEETIVLLKEKAPWCKVVVGGAVLTKEYAEKIGADCYAVDALATVRYAEFVEKQ